MDTTHSSLPLDQIRIHSTFDTLFPRRQHVLDALKDHINAHGFDGAFPLILANGPWTDSDVLLDGHCRKQVCNELGLEAVPVVRGYFETEAAALRYAIHVQKDRRNLTDAEIVNCVKTLDQLRTVGRPNKLASCEANSEKGKSAERTAAVLGVSRSKVEKVRTILKYGGDEMQDSIQAGRSINQTYKEVQMQRKEETGSGFIIGDTPPVSEPTAYRTDEDDKVYAPTNGAEEDHDDGETDEAAFDSSVAQIGVPTGASDPRNGWALEVITGFDSGPIDYIIIGKGTPPEEVTDHQQVFKAPPVAPGKNEAIGTEGETAAEESPADDSSKWSGPVNLTNYDREGWELLEKSWTTPAFAPEPPDRAATERVVQEGTVEGTPLQMTQLSTGADNLASIAEQRAEPDPVLDPRIAQILDLKATHASNIVVKFLIQEGLCRIGSLGSILTDRARLLAYLIERDANDVEGFTRLLAEFKAGPWVDAQTDEDLKIDLHGSFFEYPYGARWFWETCSTKDGNGFIWSEGGFKKNVLAFMAQHGLKRLEDIVQKVARMDEELRPRRSDSVSTSPAPGSAPMPGDLSGAAHGHEHRTFACATG